MAVGAAWGYAWGGCNWRGGNVDVDIDRNVNINNTHINRQNYQANLRHVALTQAASGSMTPAIERVSPTEIMRPHRSLTGARMLKLLRRANHFAEGRRGGRQDLARGGSQRVG